MGRSDGRSNDQLRPIKFTRNWLNNAEGSVLVEFGNTRVLCVASFTPGVPRWLVGKGEGWVTSEYAMLPRATHTRSDRESVKGKLGGRTQEISRLVGRSLRGIVDMKALGENTIVIDCDVLQADGGTRTAAITGAYVALGKHAGEIKVLGLIDFPDLPDVEESGITLSENAKLKAKAISDFTNLPALADDSGLFIDALNSDPGILSARWGGYQGSNSAIRDQINISKVLDQLKNVRLADRTAQFKAVVYFYMKKNNGVIVEKEELGILPGAIITEPRGSGGFGYDPIFVPVGFDQTLAEISPEVKDEVSHRGIAMRAITTSLLSNL